MFSPTRLLLLGCTVVAATVASVAVPATASVVSARTIGNEAIDARERDANTARAPYRGRLRAPAEIGFVRVVLDEQRTYVFNTRRKLIATIPSSTGLDDTTPTGTFTVFSKSAQTFYTPNPAEKMRWMVRFTKGREGGNIGFHGIPYRVNGSVEVPFRTPLGQEPSSHGCIRLAVPDAKWIFDNIDIGTMVSVVRTRG